MLKWLKRKIRSWLKEEEPPITSMECWIGGSVRRMAVGSARGLKLEVMDGTGQYLVGAEKALDQKLFWKAWKQKTGNVDLRWEDGSKCDPERDL